MQVQLQKQNLHTNSSSACQVWYKRQKEGSTEVSLFLPQGGLNHIILALYGLWYWRYGLLFKIAIFGDET